MVAATAGTTMASNRATMTAAPTCASALIRTANAAAVTRIHAPCTAKPFGPSKKSR